MIKTIMLIVISFSFAGIGLPNSLLGSAWPSMYGDIGVQASSMGIISMILMGGTVVASFLSGKLLGYVQTSTVVTVNMFIIVLAVFGFAVSGSFVFLCIYAVPLGIGIGFADAALNNYSAMYFEAKHMNWQHCFWGVGAAIGPVVMSYGMAAGSWRIGYQIIGVMVLVIAVMLCFSVPLWRKIAGASGRVTNDAKTPHSYGSLFRLRGFKLSVAVFFIYVSAEVTVMLWGSSYLVFVKDITPELAAGWISLFFLGITLGRFCSGVLAMLLNQSQIVWLGCALFACGIVFIELPIGNAAFMVGFFLIGLGCAPIFPNVIYTTPIRFGAEYSQSAIGIQICSANIGATVTPPLFGLIAARVGYGFFPVFLGILLAVLVFMIAMLNKVSPKKKSENAT
jgi:fucose permease